MRRATRADAAKLSLIGNASFLETFAHDHDGEALVRYLEAEQSPGWWRAALDAPATAAWLVEEAAGCPIGYAMTQPAALPFTDAAEDYELKRIYVLSRWHRAGWGRQLYERAEAEARANGARRMVLSVYVDNRPAQAFYARQGYSTIGRWLFEGFDASEDLILAKSL